MLTNRKNQSFTKYFYISYSFTTRNNSYGYGGITFDLKDQIYPNREWVKETIKNDDTNINVITILNIIELSEEQFHIFNYQKPKHHKKNDFTRVK